MKKLIEMGHIYVARPPLFKVEHKKQVRYVQTLDTMSQELMDRGLEGARLEVAPPEPKPGEKKPAQAAPSAIFEKEKLRALVAVLDDLEKHLVILERRGLSVPSLLAQLKNGKLPSYRVHLGRQEHWFFTSDEIDAFRAAQQKDGHELIVADDETGTHSTNGHGEIFAIQELHEIKSVNSGLEKLAGLGLEPTDLIPAPRVAGREPKPRFFLESEGKKQVLPHVRVVVAEIRKMGEKGIKIVRFKGLGEMDGEELWDTTLDPARRTLLRVQLDDALKADEMFRILMGEKVEPRRDFIHKHALEVNNVDYHGA